MSIGNESPQRQVVFVLGMHRGGTSALARGVGALGVGLGERLMPAVPEQNARGFWEDLDVVSLNDRVLIALGRTWDSLEPIAPEEWRQSALESLSDEAEALLRRRLDEYPVWGVKDPRASRLLPFWQPLLARLGVRTSYVIALRNPLSVARSLAVRNGFAAEKSYLLWLTHMLAAVSDTADSARVVVDYDRLLRAPEHELERVARTLGLPVDDGVRAAVAAYARDFLSQDLRHSAFEPEAVRADPRTGELVARAYDLLHGLALDDLKTPDDILQFGKEWQGLTQVLHDTAPIFHYLDACEDRIDVLTPATEPPVPPALELPAALKAAQPIVAMGIQPKPRGPVPGSRVSVVIPLYNHAQYIETTINSVLAQTIRPDEIIVIDDGSTDGSREMMNRLCGEIPELIFWTWPNQGAHHTLNAAIYRATGDYVAILNSDDIYDPERLEACLAVVRSDPSVDVVATGVSFIDDHGQPLRSAWYEDARAFYQERGDLPLALFHANFLLTTSNLFIRRTVFESVGYFAPLRYAHDLEFFLRLILANRRIHFLDRPLLAYRMHEQNTIAESQARVDIELAAIYAHFLHRQWLAGGAGDEWRSWLDRYVQVLGEKKLLDTVEFFLALLRGEDGCGMAVVDNSALGEFRGLLLQLGVDWGARAVRGSLLAQLVAARNTFLRRWERSSDGSKAKVAFAKQEQTIAALRQAFDQQERNIDALRRDLAASGQAADEKDRALEGQAQEIHALHDVLVEKDRALEGQAQEIHALHDVLVEKDRALEGQAQEIHALHDVLVEKDRALEGQAQEIHALHDVLVEKERATQLQAAEIHRLQDLLIAEEQAVQAQAIEIQKVLANARDLEQALAEKEAALGEKERELAVLKRSHWNQLGETLRQKRLNLRLMAKAAYHLMACLMPQRWKPALRPWVDRLKRRYGMRGDATSLITRHAVRRSSDSHPERTRVLHVIANFMLGGSSRLIVDLIEGLGDTYQHKVVTSFLPDPPAYAGVDVIEFRSPQSPEDVLAFLQEYDPSIVHVHYWGDVDWSWYDIFFRAVKKLECPVLENINTPVEPYKADFIDRYVYVSNYVRDHFADDRGHNVVIYPGSDFGLFSRREDKPLPADCIGMVYRLETDKLNPQAIDVFIKVAQRRPQTRVLIVGGGTYLEPYRQAASAAGVVGNFEFTGYVEYVKLPALYERMTIFVAPVWKESFGQVGPFAMNLGIPVVGYQVGGLSEIVGDASLLAPPGNSDALADLVIELLDDPVRCQEIGARNHARAQELFSVGAMTEAYRGVYTELLGVEK